MSFALLKYDFDDDDDDGENYGESDDYDEDTCFLEWHAPQDVSAGCLQHCKFQTHNDSDDEIDNGYNGCDDSDDDIDNGYFGKD